MDENAKARDLEEQALAAVAGEVALAGQDLETRYRTGSASDGHLAGEAANRHGGRGVVAG
jgi:hypothetical protein